MTIRIGVHQSPDRTVKADSLEHVHTHLRGAVPPLGSYPRLVERMPTVVLPGLASLHPHLGACPGISGVDSPPLPVCHPARIRPHRVVAGTAGRGKPAVGGVYSNPQKGGASRQ
jgi:hypothetical protein